MRKLTSAFASIFSIFSLSLAMSMPGSAVGAEVASVKTKPSPIANYEVTVTRLNPPKGTVAEIQKMRLSVVDEASTNSASYTTVGYSCATTSSASIATCTYDSGVWVELSNNKIDLATGKVAVKVRMRIQELKELRKRTGASGELGEPVESRFISEQYGLLQKGEAISTQADEYAFSVRLLGIQRD